MLHQQDSEEDLRHNIGASCHKHASKWKVSAAVHPADFIFQFLLKNPSFADVDDAVRYYFDDGRKSAELLKSILANELSINVAVRTKMLEFASGYGAVTRHLTAVLPTFDITSSDIHSEANDFITTQLGGTAIRSSSVPERFDAAAEYDLVFALSFFSHMPKATWQRWLEALFKALRVGGSLIFTTHGATTLRKMLVDVSLDDDGFYFKPESEQDDLEKSEYGTAVTSNRFVIEQVETLDNCELSLIRAGLWWGHQDLYVLSKIASASVAAAGLPRSAGCAFHNLDRINALSQPFALSDVRVTAGQDLIVEGWAFDANANALAASVEVVVDGIPYEASYGLERRDVADYFNRPGYLRSGFMLRLPGLLLGKGPHELKIRVISTPRDTYWEGHALRVECQ
ncbi:MAG TPA: class I SAM-dependent methyltransferase [Terrimicrobiaceae bacterium]